MSLTRLSASLALITILGPSAIDMYLASLPDMAQELKASFTHIQLTLTVFLVAMGLGQLISGPIIDAMGRRRPLLFAILIFSVCSIWASWAVTIQMLLYARFMQGLAASMTLVVAISTVRDVSSGTQAAKLFALLMTIEGLAPVLAPAIGGFVDTHAGWRAVMLVLASMGLLAFVNSWFNLPESLPSANRQPLNLVMVLRRYSRLLSDAGFMMPALSLSAAFFFLFIYIGGAPIIYQQHYHLQPDTFGLVFGGTGVAVLLGAISAGHRVTFKSVPSVARQGVILMAVGAVIAGICNMSFVGLPGVITGMFIAMFGLGVAEATLMSMTMSTQKTALGSAAAVLGALQLMLSATATPLAGYLSSQSSAHWLGFMSLFGIVVVILTVLTIRAAKDVNYVSSH
ncbi:TPA: multidrug effflux MFS transporter [Serratia marcescens]|uniref:multidrug effflux MFS transporter n=1 Tax=Serratia ureilytica TaxID=300181 RepID=UPI0018D9FDE6|nr:multidrug effflux MFS transporter [Serratia ureilytica]MBH3319132.1 multidrug effflux MFS transporter [Serratia ureilytica]